MSQIPVPSVGALNLAGSLGRTGQAQREVQQNGSEFSSMVQGANNRSPAGENVGQAELSSERDADAFYYRPSSQQEEQGEQQQQHRQSESTLSDSLEKYRSHRPVDPHGELGTRLDIEV